MNGDGDDDDDDDGDHRSQCGIKMNWISKSFFVIAFFWLPLLFLYIEQ